MQSVDVLTPGEGSTPVSTNYGFVNWIRLVATFSIVYEHSLLIYTVGPSQVRTYQMVSQPFKFGTICFFIISGYLLGRKLTPDDSPWLYYRRRLLSVGLPFVIAFGLYYLKMIGVFGRLTGKLMASELSTTFLVKVFYTNLFFTSYWFVFSLLTALAILFLFWRQTKSLIFGWVSFAVTCFFAANIYNNWFDSAHTIAMPAYVFYLWLGTWLARNNAYIKRMQSLSSPILTIILLLTMGLAYLESDLLWSLKASNPTNTLRPTNQLFSLVAFLWLIRHDPSKQLTAWLNPRTESFGIYLYHMFFVDLATNIAIKLPYLNWLSDSPLPSLNPGEIVLIDLVRICFVYGSTLCFVKLINRTRLRWIFGERS
ncbi:MAG: acyltransferase [Pedobacter sp.]|nr:MAG: acyltransferase [Pedobacter sp.]